MLPAGAKAPQRSSYPVAAPTPLCAVRLCNMILPQETLDRRKFNYLALSEKEKTGTFESVNGIFNQLVS